MSTKDLEEPAAAAGSKGDTVTFARLHDLAFQRYYYSTALKMTSRKTRFAVTQ
jgi:hypothetical protein